MAIKKIKRPPAATIAAARAFLKIVKQLSNYAPTDPLLSIEALCAAEEQLIKAEAAVVRSERAYARARAAGTASTMSLLNIIFGGGPIVLEPFNDQPDLAQLFGQKKVDVLRSVRRTTLSA